MTTVQVDESYDPEALAILDESLRGAAKIAAKIEGSEWGEEVRIRMAAALIEGAKMGIRDSEALIGFALRALPTFQSQLD